MDAWTLQSDAPKPKPTPRLPRQKRPTKERQRLDRETERWVEEQGILITERERIFRHSHWQAQRDRITRHLRMTGASERNMFRWNNCGGGAVVWYSPKEQRHIVRASYCHSRHCEPCMRAKANRIANNLQNQLKRRPVGRYRFVTFTLKHTTQPLADQIRRLYKAFADVRATKFWKRTQAGGLFTLEVKWNPAGSVEDSTGRIRLTDEWHPHLHAIAEGEWLDQRELRKLWLLKTHDSSIVHVTILHDVKEASHYVTKYVTKGTSPAVWQNDDAAQEWITASKGVRCAATYGSWRGLKLTARSPLPDDLVRIATLDQLHRDAELQKPYATAVILSLRPPGTADHPNKDPPKTADKFPGADATHSNDCR